MAIFDIRRLSFRYPESDIDALHDVNITIEEGAFVTVVGATGSGKSTLLRLLKPELEINGEKRGDILYDGKPLSAPAQRESAAQIGYVAQNPEEQIVTDKVWHELAFTLENLGVRQSEIARRIAETAAYFGISPWYRQSTASLSGGQKQLLNLAAATVAQPRVLLLDEPTAQLDPIAAARFIEMLVRLNRETGVTVVISEHRAEELIPVSDRLLALDGGRVGFDDTPRRATADKARLPYLTCAARIFLNSGGEGECPLSVREGQRYFRERCSLRKDSINPQPPAQTVPSEKGAFALELKDVFFRYEKSAPDVLDGLSMSVRAGEIFAVLGANGCGKSTAAAVMAGIRKSYSGKVKLFGKQLKEYKDGSLYRNNLSLLPQDTESMFLRASVREELKGCEDVLRELPFELEPLYDRHPYDLSGGERQIVALCRALASKPRVLILDEPSKGLDPTMKDKLRGLLLKLKQDGVTVVMVSHDVEFAALCADRCALFFDGKLAACESTADFMRTNRSYTTAAARITRGQAYTTDGAVKLLT